MLYNILLIVQIIVSISMISLILMQHGKGADAGAAFGSGASGTVFGSRGATNFLSRTTAILATIFFVNCLGLAYIVAHKDDSTAASVVESIVKEQPAPAKKNTPTTPSDVPSIGETNDKGKTEAPKETSDIPAVPMTDTKKSD